MPSNAVWAVARGPIPFVRMRLSARLAVAAIVVAGLAACAVFVLASGRFAPGSGAVVRAAQRDALWAHVPAGSQETSRYATRADAGWIPWSNHVTSVGRYYRSPGGADAPPPAWAVAAEASGWTAVPACGPDWYTKKVSGASASLTIDLDPTRAYVLVAIRFAAAGAGRLCGG